MRHKVSIALYIDFFWL